MAAPQPQLLPIPRSTSEPVLSDEARSLSAFLVGAKLLVHEAVLRLGGYEEVADHQFLVSGTTDRDLAAEFAFLVNSGVDHLQTSDFLL